MTNFVPDELFKWTERTCTTAHPKNLKSLAFGNLTKKRSGKFCVITSHLDSWEEGFMEFRRYAACDEGECDATWTMEESRKYSSRIHRDKFSAVPRPLGPSFAATGAALKKAQEVKEWIDKRSIAGEKAGTLTLRQTRLHVNRKFFYTNLARLQWRSFLL
jgi:hypothetical protein